MPAQAYEKTLRGDNYSHIYNKALSDQNIFRDQEDFDVFLGYLKEYLNPANDISRRRQTFTVRGRTFNGVPHQPKNYHGAVELAAYSLLPDHFHLLIKQISEKSLEKLMRSLSTRYSIYYNKKYNRNGPVFQGPYKSVLLAESSVPYLTEYLHDEKHNQISSHLDYQGNRNTEWIKVFDKKLNTNSSLTGEDLKHFLKKICIEEPVLTEKTATPQSEVIPPLVTESAEEVVYSKPSWFPRIALTLVSFALLFGLGLSNVTINSQQKHRLVLSAQAETTPQPTIQPLPTTIPEPTVAPEEPVAVTLKLTVKSLSSTRVNIREQAQANSNILAKANHGDIYQYISKQDSWYQIILSDGEGYIHQDFVEEVAE